MTTIALNYSQNLLEGFFRVLKKTLQGIMVGYMVARQTEANKVVAQQMINAGEYRQDEFYALLSDLNTKTISSIHREVCSESN